MSEASLDPEPSDDEVDDVLMELVGSGSVDPLSGDDGRLRLSFSRVDVFERCPRRFRYQYVDGLPQSPAPQLSFGTSIHAVLEWIYDRKHPVLPSLDETLGILFERWDSSGYAEMARDQQLQAYEHAREVIARFHGRLASEGFRLPAATEAWFELPIDDDILVVGSIDRLDVDPSGDLHVIDYKTNRRARSKAQVSGSLQLAIYALATEFLYGRLPRSVALDFVVPGVTVRVPLEELDVASVPERLREAARRIRLGEDTPTPHRLCDWCDFRSICPAWVTDAGRAEEVVGLAMRERDRLRRSIVRDGRRLAQLEAGLARVEREAAEERQGAGGG